MAFVPRRPGKDEMDELSKGSRLLQEHIELAEKVIGVERNAVETDPPSTLSFVRDILVGMRSFLFRLKYADVSYINSKFVKGLKG